MSVFYNGGKFFIEKGNFFRLGIEFVEKRKDGLRKEFDFNTEKCIIGSTIFIYLNCRV